jgi:hypothetical protein
MKEDFYNGLRMLLNSYGTIFSNPDFNDEISVFGMYNYFGLIHENLRDFDNEMKNIFK